MGYLNEWLRKLRSGEQLPKKNHLLLILLAGILLLVVTFPDVRSKPSADESEDGSASVMNENTDLQKYADDREKEIAGILSRVEGVGKVEVMITLKSGNRKIVEKDERSTRDDAAEETSVYRQNADGSSEPYVNTELIPAECRRFIRALRKYGTESRDRGGGGDRRRRRKSGRAAGDNRGRPGII